MTTAHPTGPPTSLLQPQADSTKARVSGSTARKASCERSLPEKETRRSAERMERAE